MKKIIFIALMLHMMCATSWAANLDTFKYYVYCTASGRPDTGNGSDVSNYLKRFNNPSTFLITPSGFSNKAEADKYMRSLNGRCPKKK